MNLPAVAITAADLDKLHAGKKVVLVPTMGSLHEGHLALVRKARELADRLDALVCTSIFVNPLQFGPSEDFDVYPRQLEADLDALAGLADTCFAPTTHEMYPQQQTVFVHCPELGGQLCGAHRPGFFEGVLTVVLKLFSLARPTVAVFGVKDYQQLVLIKNMTHQFHLNINIEAVATVRETDDLACSSRNALLEPSARENAPQLHSQLKGAVDAIAAGIDAQTACEKAIDGLAKTGFVVDYVECRMQESLEPWTGSTADFIVLGAARLGSVRLIDNIFGPS
jgi:pantoate--beta-alanine ligase